MERLVELSVLPLYAQVVVQDAGTADIPDWPTGDEAVVSTDHSVLVATRPDIEGLVTITVLLDDLESHAGLGNLIFEGELKLTSTEVEIGSPVAAVVRRIDVGPVGAVGIRIFVKPLDRPEVVTVLLRGSTSRERHSAESAKNARA